MKRPIILSLASGSKANCTLVSTGKTHVLIDFGLSVRRVRQALSSVGIELGDISAVFITHEHIDHVAGLPTFLKSSEYKDVPVYFTQPSYLEYIRKKGFEFRHRLTVIDTEFSSEVGELRIRSLPVRHDSAACVAYKIYGGGISLGICTDVGCPTNELLSFFSGCESVVTEANYDEKMLRYGIYPEALKYRITSDSGHTSNVECARFVCGLAENGVKNVLLAHISPENNTPELAVYEVSKELLSHGLSLSFLKAAPREDTIEIPCSDCAKAFTSNP